MSSILTREIALRCSRDHAFTVFTQRIDLWWPKTHRKDSSAVLVLEGALGGRLFERSNDGSEWTIGQITDWVLGQKLVFDWFPGSPAAPTCVSVRFEAAGEDARILIEHSAVSRAALDVWPERVALFARGWDTILPPFQQYCDSHSSPDNF